MKISRLKGSNKQSGLCRLSVKGDMTIYTAEQMMQVCIPYLEQYKEFELDLSSVTDIDSAGVQILLMFHRKSRHTEHKTHLLTPSEDVTQVINTYNLNQSFNLNLNP